MQNAISFKEFDSLDDKTCIQINTFLKENKFNYNTLFSSPIWINKAIQNYDVNFKIILFFNNDKLIGTHLRFCEYRGYIRISNYNKAIKPFFSYGFKFFFPYTIWKIPILLSKTISKEQVIEIHEAFETIIKKEKHVKFSPLEIENYTKFENKYISYWATYLLNLKSKSYDEVFSKYSRSLKRSLKHINNQSEICCQRLDFSDWFKVKKYVDWVKVAQKMTGKKFKYDTKTLIQENESFNRQGFTYEIFIATSNDTDIHGSLAIYGDSNYINEFEANTSLEANKLNARIHDLIRDSVIKFCLKKGIQYYDFSGFNPNEDRSSKEEGIKFGKSKFNATEIKYPIVNW